MFRHFIIPAAGKATRFNGIHKELAPLPNGNTSLSHALDLARASAAIDIIVLTHSSKWWLHSEFIRLYEKQRNIKPGLIRLVMQQDYTYDLWSAIIQGLYMQPDLKAGGLILPDTITDFNPEYAQTSHDGLSFGVFDTHEPQRFSIIQDEQIITKPDYLPEGIYKAWGVVLWSAIAQRRLRELSITRYDDAFQQVMDRLGHETFPLDYYYDLGTYAAYVDYTADANEGLYGN